MLTTENLIRFWSYQKALNYGFFPDVSDDWAEPALEAIELVLNGEFNDTPANQPFGCDYSADTIIEALHLEVFINSDDTDPEDISSDFWL